MACGGGCTVAFGLDTLDEALAAENTADETDLETAGCGGFGWTRYEGRLGLEPVGVWQTTMAEKQQSQAHSGVVVVSSTTIMKNFGR